MYNKVITLSLILITLITMVADTVKAHRPLDTTGPATRENPIFITNHQVSWAAYNQLSPEGVVHYYRFLAHKNETIYASMLIPYLKRLKEFNPVIALIIPQPGKEQLPDNYQININDDEKVIIRRFKGDENQTFFEPFTQTIYWQKQKLEIKAPVTGIYYLAVFDPDRDEGKYVLGVGKEEKWGLKDLLAFPSIWWNIRMFMEKRLSTYIKVVTLLLLLLYFSKYLFKLLRR